jgi:hypothetical protein
MGAGDVDKITITFSLYSFWFYLKVVGLPIFIGQIWMTLKEPCYDYDLTFRDRLISGLFTPGHFLLEDNVSQKLRVTSFCYITWMILMAFHGVIS